MNKTTATQKRIKALNSIITKIKKEQQVLGRKADNIQDTIKKYEKEMQENLQNKKSNDVDLKKILINANKSNNKDLKLEIQKTRNENENLYTNTVQKYNNAMSSLIAESVAIKKKIGSNDTDKRILTTELKKLTPTITLKKSVAPKAQPNVNVLPVKAARPKPAKQVNAVDGLLGINNTINEESKVSVESEVSELASDVSTPPPRAKSLTPPRAKSPTLSMENVSNEKSNNI